MAVNNSTNQPIIWNNTPVLSKINVAGTEYWLKDAEAREKIEMLHNVAAMHFIGVALLDPTDGDESVIQQEVGYFPAYVATGDGQAICYYYGTKPTATSITSNGVDYVIKDNIELSAGDVFIYKDAEYVFSTSDEQFHRLGTTGSFKAFAYADKGKFTYTPTGSVSVELDVTKGKPTVNVTQGSVTATGKFTPEGSVSIAAGSTETVINSVTPNKKYLAYSEIATGVKPTTSTLKTSNIHTDVSKTAKVLETKTITQVGDTITVPNVTGNSNVSIPNVTGNSPVTASKVSKVADAIEVAKVGTQVSVVSSVAVAPTVVTGFNESNTEPVVKTVTKRFEAMSVANETLVIPDVNYLSAMDTTSTNVVSKINPTTSTQTADNTKITPAVKTSIADYTIESVEASKVTLGTALSASKVTLGTALSVAGVGTEVTVASGKVTDSDKSGASIITDVTTAGEMAVVTGLTTGTSVVTGVSTDTKTPVVTGLVDSGKEGDEVITGVKTGTTTVMKSIGAATFTGTEGNVTVSGSTTGVSANLNSDVVTEVSVKSTGFTGNAATVEVQPVTE